jgi:purine-nucleoside phosphorylase
MDIELLEKALQSVKQRLHPLQPSCALVLGSGWGTVVDALGAREIAPYTELPGLGDTGVDGHAGRLLVTSHGGRDTLVFQGRRHWYEGCGWTPIAAPVYIAAGLGVRSVLLTNAAGGIRSSLSPGDLMVIDDHINAMGVNPLIGPHRPPWGPRFPDQTCVYDPRLRHALDEAARRDGGTEPAHGVYLATAGPTYETPAEVRVYRGMGADAVGMSTVPEAILANAAGLKVAGLSCITNMAAGKAGPPLRHEDVVAATAEARTRMSALLAAFLAHRPGDA